MIDNGNIEYTLIQIIEYFSFTFSQKEIAKKLWKGSEKNSIKGWEKKFVQKGLIVK